MLPKRESWLVQSIEAKEAKFCLFERGALVQLQNNCTQDGREYVTFSSAVRENESWAVMAAPIKLSLPNVLCVIDVVTGGYIILADEQLCYIAGWWLAALSSL